MTSVVSNCSFSANVGGERAPAFGTSSFAAIIEDTTFEANEANRSCSAVTQSVGTLTVRRCRFIRNVVRPTSPYRVVYGGSTVAYLSSSNFNLTDSEFVDNSCTNCVSSSVYAAGFFFITNTCCHF